METLRFLGETIVTDVDTFSDLLIPPQRPEHAM